MAALRRTGAPSELAVVLPEPSDGRLPLTVRGLCGSEAASRRIVASMYKCEPRMRSMCVDVSGPKAECNAPKAVLGGSGGERCFATAWGCKRDSLQPPVFTSCKHTRLRFVDL